MSGTIIIGFKNETIQSTESEGMQITPNPTNFTVVEEGNQAGPELWKVVAPIIILLILPVVVLCLVCGLLHRRRKMRRARFRNVSEVL